MTHIVVTSGLLCPPDMVQQNCSCQGTCEDPHGCHGDCFEGVACVCPNGFLLNGTSCIPHQDCGCFYDGHVIPVSMFDISPNAHPAQYGVAINLPNKNNLQPTEYGDNN